MKMVANGASRQEAHGQIRVISHEASDVVKGQGGSNDLIKRLKNTEYFKPVWDEIDAMLDPKLFIGRSVEIVEKYCGKSGLVREKLVPYMDYITQTSTVQLNI